MAFDGLSAFGAIRALAKAGVSVPKECSVIGFGGVAPSTRSSPALTTIRQPLEEMGSGSDGAGGGGRGAREAGICFAAQEHGAGAGGEGIDSSGLLDRPKPKFPVLFC